MYNFGLICISVYCLMTAGLAVLFSKIFQVAPLMPTVGIGLAGVTLVLVLVKPNSAAGIKKAFADKETFRLTALLNLSVAFSWPLYFYSLKMLPPTVAVAASGSVMFVYNTFRRFESYEEQYVRPWMSASFLMLMGIVVVSSADISHPNVISGLVAAALSSGALFINARLANKLAKRQFTTLEIFPARSVLLICTGLGFAMNDLETLRQLSASTWVLIALAFGLTAVAVMLAQLGAKSTSVSTMFLLDTTVAALTYIFQLFDERFTVSFVSMAALLAMSTLPAVTMLSLEYGRGTGGGRD